MSEWWKPSKPEELKAVPWLHPAVVLYLESLIQKKWRALEFGGGGSTLWLAKRCLHVTTVESNAAYYAALEKVKPKNVKLLDKHPAVITDTYDLMIVDGEPLKARAWFLENARYLMRGGGIVVLDNATQPEYARQRSELMGWAKHHITLDVNPPGHQHCVTDIYRMGGGLASWI